MKSRPRLISLNKVPHGRTRRVMFLLVTGLIVTLYFMIKSRYPQLNEKALMAKSGTIGDLLSAWPKLEVLPSFSLSKKILYTGINWLYDNKIGMSVGIFLGGIFFTVFRYLKPFNHENRWLNSLYGFVMGTPLGVCVNCAAPIFKGVLRSQRIETAFSMMLSSPTMNIVVLTMVFSLFPFYMGIIKISFTFIMVFFFVPVFAKIFANEKLNDLHRIEEKTKAEGSFFLTVDEGESWWRSFLGAYQDLLRGLWFIFSRTFPLMVVAGFLGSAISHTLPTDFFMGSTGVFGLLLFSLVSVLLPTPMAFDIMLSNALYSAGLPPSMVLVLLCSLGIFSIFSFFIVWQSASLRWGLALLTTITVLASGLSLIGDTLHRHFYINPNIQAYLAMKENFGEGLESAIDRQSVVSTITSPVALANPYKLVKREKNLEMHSRPLQNKKGQAGHFVKKEGHHLGLAHGFRYGIRDYPDPFWIGRGTGSGDFNNDGWEDIAFGTDVGISLYRNNGGWFERIPLSQEFLNKQKVYTVAFVDFNNDGWLDLFFSTYVNGNYILINKKGQFKDLPVQVPNHNAIVTVSPAFADLDGNGEVDVFNGNMAMGIVTGFFKFGPQRSNSISYNHQLNFTEEIDGTLSGETMSTLISDINNDGLLDIYESNDFVVPDRIQIGLKSNRRKNLEQASAFIERTPFYSMSSDSGDFNNDLRLDFLTTGTIATKHPLRHPIDGRSPAQYSQEKWGLQFCDKIEDSVIRQNCILIRQSDHLVQFDQRKNLDVKSCQKMTDPTSKQACLLSTMWMIVTNNAPVEDCERDFGKDQLLLETCHLMRQRGGNYKQTDFTDGFIQYQGNFLYQADGVGHLNLVSEDDFPHPGGWTWNTKFGDFDNDGWLDIFGAEGSVRTQGFGWNTFFHNQQGRKFELKPFSMNVIDDFNLFSFVMIDYDNDGDLDVIGNSSTGPVQIYENQLSAENHSVSVELQDLIANRSGIGSRVYLHLSSGTTLLREIKSSGGYQSFDAPKAHFGVGKHELIDKISVTWADGQATVVTGPFAVDQQYRVTRTKNDE